MLDADARLTALSERVAVLEATMNGLSSEITRDFDRVAKRLDNQDMVTATHHAENQKALTALLARNTKQDGASEVRSKIASAIGSTVLALLGGGFLWSLATGLWHWFLPPPGPK